MKRPLKPVLRRLATLVPLVLVLTAGGVAAASSAATTSPPVISVWEDVTQWEGNTSAVAYGLVFQRTGDLSNASSAKVTITDGTATHPSDYTAAAYATTITFPAGVDYVGLDVKFKGDVVVEPNEYFLFTLSDPVGATIGDGTGFATILNDDSDAAPTFSIEDEPSFIEGDAGTVGEVFRITRSGSTAASASVKFATSNGSATAPSDYTAKLPTGVFFAVGQTERTVMVSIKGDLVPEPDETFTVHLSAPVRATIADGDGLGTILNDDSSATPSFYVDDATVFEGDGFSKTLTLGVRRQGNLQGTSTVRYATADGTAVSPDDYGAKAGTLTFRPGDTTKTLTISIKGDTQFELDKEFTVNLSAPTGGVIADGTGVVEIWNDDE